MPLYLLISVLFYKEVFFFIEVAENLTELDLAISFLLVDLLINTF